MMLENVLTAVSASGGGIPRTAHPLLLPQQADDALAPRRRCQQPMGSLPRSVLKVVDYMLRSQGQRPQYGTRAMFLGVMAEEIGTVYCMALKNHLKPVPSRPEEKAVA